MDPIVKPSAADSSETVAVQLASAPPNPAIIPRESDLTSDHSPGSSAGRIAPRVAEGLPAAFGRYHVRKALGAGGFGTVYLGHDSQLDRPVAIKVLRGGPDVPQAEAERFLQEARRLAQLRHPGIVAVHDVGLHEGQVYIVSDYLDGVDLSEWLKHNSPSWRDAARIAAAVADALAHAHARLTVHRDVKPANIIITRDCTPVLVDFGLGLDEAGAGGHEKGVVSGTPWYMAPEQVAGEAHRIDGRTDIYSLAVVLYQMLCGRVPFRANDIQELLRQVRDDEPQPPRQLVGDIPPELERVCLKALAKRLSDRYTTAADFAGNLRRASESTGGPAIAASFRHPLSETPARDSDAVQPPPTQQGAQTASTLQRRAREAERRQVTVLVCGCDLFESEAYLEDLDAEDQAKVLRAFQQTCEQVVRQFDGTVVQCNEQGLLVCVGYPVAYEDAARRAALIGLGIREEMKSLCERLRREHRLELIPWVGIHTGPAIVESADDAVSLVGEARNVAIRLEDVAQPGQIICSAATHLLIHGHFECSSVGQRKIKGVAQPVDMFLVQGVAAAGSLIEATGPAGLTPLTGRDHEVSLLNDRWEQAKEGMGQVVLITGEPGLGKSRLVHTIKQFVREQTSEPGETASESSTHVASASSQPAQASHVIEWRCSPQSKNSSLYPVREFFERFLGHARDQAPASKFERLVRHLGEYGLDRPDVVPLFASLLSLPTDDRFPALGLSPVRDREETFRALHEWVRSYSERRPVLFIVEDLHWMDASTLEFLGQYLADSQYDRVLTLLAFRPEFQPPWPAMTNQTGLALSRLTRRQVGDLIKRKTGGTLPEEVIDQIYERTGGVPLFVEEFTKMAQESDVLVEAGGSGNRAKALMMHAIPATLQDLLMTRLDRMEGNREVAQLASALGREFSYELLAAAAVQDEPTLQAELAKLVHAEILYSKGRPPRCTYIFKHALLEDALYNALVKGRREHFHRRIADGLEVGFPQLIETQPELLAHHLTEAGMPEKAISYWLKAGLRSRERVANVEAIGHLTKGLALLATLDESPQRDALELELLSPLGTAYLAARGYAAPQVGPVFRRARALCERIGQPPHLFAVMRGNWVFHLVRGDFRLCMDLADELVEFADRLNDPGILMEVLFLKGVTLLYRGDFAGARDHCVRAADYDDPERTRFWATHTGQNASVTHRCYLAVSLWHLGYPDQALKVNREMRELARELGHPFSMGYALHHTGWLLHHCGLGTELQSVAEEQIRIATKQGFSQWHATGTFFRGAGLLLQGKLEDALPLLMTGLEAFRAGGAELTLPLQLSTLGEAHMRGGRLEDARRALQDGLAIAEKNDDRFQEAELHRLEGELLLAESPDRASEAEVCFRRAIALARGQGSRAWELRATLSLARLLRQQGRSREAHRDLFAVRAKYAEGWTTPDLLETQDLLEALT